MIERSGRPVKLPVSLIARIAERKIRPVSAASTAGTAGLTRGQQVAGRYQVVRPIGAGGMGVVYRAIDTTGGEDVALKVVHADGRRGAAMALQHEFRSMTRLVHPNLTRVLDYGATEVGKPFFTMELVEGIDLDKCPRLDYDEIRWVLAEIAAALAFIHSRGLVHRDLKPANVRLVRGAADRFVGLKVMDLGTMTRAGGRSPGITGTPSYLPPEAIVGGAVDRRSDLYSLGVIAYELCCGRPPHRIRSLEQLLDVDFRTPPDPRALRRDLPADLHRLIGDMLALDPGARPFDAAEVAARLGVPLESESDRGERAYLTTAVCVGRTRELGLLRERWFDVRRGSVADIRLRGPAGVGKTRLVREFLVEAKLDGALVLEAGCRDRAAMPFAVLRALLEPLALREVQLAPLRSIDEAGLLARVVPALGVLEPPLPPGATYLDPAYERERMFEVIAAWLAALAAEQPVVVAVDDLQWCDAGSLDAVTALMRHRPDAPIMVVTTERTGEGGPDPRLPGEAVELGPLAPADVQALLAAMFDADAPPAPLVQYLHTTSQGSPYFLVELIRTLHEAGDIRRVAGRWRLPERPGSARLPRSLEDAIDAHIARLGAAARSLADAACVLESELDLELAQRLCGLGDEALFDAIDELTRAELLVGEAGRYRFRHARCGERLRAALPAEALARCHLRAAESLTHLVADLDARAAEIGEHFARGGDRPRAIDYLLRGAELLWQTQAYADLQRPLALARELLPEEDERALEVAARLGRAAFYSDHGSAIEHFQWLRDRYLRVGALSWLPRLSRLLGNRLALALVLGASWIACVATGRRRSLADLTECMRQIFLNTAFLASSLAYVGRFEDSVAAADALAPFVTSRDQLSHGARMIAEMTPTGQQGRLTRSAHACREALRAFELDTRTPIDPYDRAIGVCGALTALANAHHWRGDPAAREVIDRLREEIDRSELFFVRALYHQASLWFLCNHGSIEEAEAEWERYAAFHRSAGHVPLVEFTNRLWLARAWALRGRSREAHDQAQAVLDRKLGNRFVDGLAHEVLGLVDLDWGAGDGAERHLEAALAAGCHPAVRCGTLQTRAHAGLAMVAAGRRDAEAARHHAEAALALARSGDYRNEIEEAAALRALARAHTVAGDQAAALRAVALAEEVAAPLSSPITDELNAATLAWVQRTPNQRVQAADPVLQPSGAAPPPATFAIAREPTKALEDTLASGEPETGSDDGLDHTLRGRR